MDKLLSYHVGLVGWDPGSGDGGMAVQFTGNASRSAMLTGSMSHQIMLCNYTGINILV
jgi:hypothetical protein